MRAYVLNMSIDFEKMARELVWNQVLYHPLPWRIESDWTEDVIASDGHIVAKCRSHSDAMEIVELAEKIRKEVDDSCVEID